MSIHQQNCPNFKEKKIQISCDGIHENKSSPVSIDIYSMNIRHCKTIYPHKLVRPLSKYRVNSKRVLQEVIDDISLNDLRIMQYVGDNPKRSDAKGCKCHSAWYPCEYCFAKGIKITVSDNVKAKAKLSEQIALIEEKISQCQSEPSTPENTVKIDNLTSLKNELKKGLNALQRKSNILWPFSTMQAPNRSRNSIQQILEKIERGDQLSLDESKGIIERSVLFDIPDFNFTYDVPTEYLHTGCLGVIKRLVQLTFSVGPNRPRVTKRKLSSPDAFNKLMHCTKVFKEFPRRARNLDFSLFKALEFRNIAIFFFPHVIECIEPGSKEITMWLNLAYMLRASLVPSEEFSNISLAPIRECCITFYRLFEEVFGVNNCMYNLHVFCSHLLEIRTHGPLTETSAFKFESFYGEVRRSFVPRTISPLKQILKNVLLKRAISKHCCKQNISITNYNTPLECNNMIYCYKNKKHLVYQVNDINGDVFSCNKIGQYPAEFQETPNLTWSDVGVFRKGGVSSGITQITSSEIAGKVMNVGKYLITCPINVLNEK